MKQHPTMDTLLAYLETPASPEFSSLRLHIAVCADCRTSIKRLSDLQTNIHKSGHLQRRLTTPSMELSQALNQQSIERFVDGELNTQQQAQIKGLLQNDPNALKAALHYASHTASHTATLKQNMTQSTVASNTGSTGALSRFFGRLKKLADTRTPAWVTAASTAAVVIAMSAILMPAWFHWSTQTSTPHGFSVAAYQDKAVILFQDDKALPGIGFFNKAHRTTRAFGPMSINYSNGHTLLLQWPEVANVKTYDLTLYLLAEGQRITLAQMKVSDRHAAIKDFQPTLGKRYEWTLSGVTTDGKSFFATGGFVINQATDRG